MFINYEHENHVYNVTIERRKNHFFITYNNTEYRVEAEETKPGQLKIKIGELQQIDQEIFEFALSQLRSPMLKNAKFSFETVKAELRCRVCNHKWKFSTKNLDENVSEFIHFVPEIAHTYLKCPKCGSPDFEILTGRGVWLDSIRGEK